MGYDWLLRVIIADGDLQDSDKEQMSSIYEQCRNVPEFPLVGEIGHTGSQGYGCGYPEDVAQAFTLFSMYFPHITFGLYYFSADFQCVAYLQVQGDEVSEATDVSKELSPVYLGSSDEDNEDEEYDENEVLFISFEKEITNWINPETKCYCGL